MRWQITLNSSEAQAILASDLGILRVMCCKGGFSELLAGVDFKGALIQMYPGPAEASTYNAPRLSV